jgi:hypothetical protein
MYSFRYRLAPENLYPAPLEDCITASKYFLRNAEKYGVDKNRIGVKGNLNLVAIICHTFLVGTFHSGLLFFFISV